MSNIINYLFSKYRNQNTGLGDPLRDADAGTETEFPGRLDRYTIESLYLNSYFIRKAIDFPPTIAYSEGGTLKVGDEDKEIVEKINYLVLSGNRVPLPDRPSLCITEYFQRAEIAARRDGGAAIFMDIDDGQDPFEPVDINKIQSVKELRLFTRWDIQPDWQGENYVGRLEPEYYRLLTYEGSQSISRIHKSRILPFVGALVPEHDNFNIADSWWGDSLVRQVMKEVQSLEISSASVANKMQRFAAFLLRKANFLDGIRTSVKKVFGQNQLAKKTPAERSSLQSYEQKITEAGERVAYGMSNYKVAVIDRDKEDIELIEHKFQGIAPNLYFYRDLVTAVCGVPEFEMWGKHASGLGQIEKGERAMLDAIANRQRKTSKNNFDTLLTYVFLAKNSPTQGKIPQNWTWEWLPLWQPTPKEKAETAEKEALTLSRYVDMGVKLGEPILTAQEIRQSVFGGSEYGGLNIQLEESEPNTQDNYVLVDSIAMIFSDAIKTILKHKGLEIGLEFFPGEDRWNMGKTLKGCGYGHIRKHLGADKMALDCYVSSKFILNPDDCKDYPVFCLHQLTEDGEFDEHKFMIGFKTQRDAKKAYLSAMPEKFCGEITDSSWEEIKTFKVVDKSTTDAVEKLQLQGEELPLSAYEVEIEELKNT